jgi:hypothetical protein
VGIYSIIHICYIVSSFTETKALADAYEGYPTIIFENSILLLNIPIAAAWFNVTYVIMFDVIELKRD